MYLQPGITPAALAELRAYVVGGDPNALNQNPNTVMVNMTHSNLQARIAEIRLDKHMTIGDLKLKVEKHTGTKPEFMRLELLDVYGNSKGKLEGEDRPFGFYSPENGDTLHVIDDDPHSASAHGWLEDTSKVEKYEMTRDDYLSRPNAVPNVRKKMMEENPEFRAKVEAKEADKEARKAAIAEEYGSQTVIGIQVGNRCWVHTESLRGRPCTVKFVGEVPELQPGFWVGVACDDPVGGHDGTIKGNRYFECEDGHGKVVRPDKVEVAKIKTLEEELNGEDDEL